MEYQKPAQGICLMEDRQDFKRYFVQCKCGLHSDNVELFINACEHGVELDMFTESLYPNKFELSIRSRFINAVKAFVAILRGDELKFQTSIWQDEQTAFNFAQTILLAIKESQKIRKKLQKPSKKEQNKPNRE